ncbi:MAG: zinc-dependent alcohol dehydrogenase [Actinomycetes bacterium]
MRVLEFKGPWDIGVEERPDPSPGPGEVMLRVSATGICGTDVHGFTGENGRRHPGQVMGHETVGHVVAHGPDVSGPAEGEAVTVMPVLGCEQCDACRSDRRQACAERRVIGVNPEIMAAFAEYLVAPAQAVVRLPAGTREEFGALVEPLAVGYHAVRRGACGPGDTVLVVGGGPIGQAAFLGAQRLGASRVVVSEPDANRRALCATLGADTLDPSAASGDLAGAVAGVLGGPASLVVDAVGSSGSLADSLAASATGATVVLVGMHVPRVEIPAYAVSTGERALVGSFCYSREDFDDTAAWVGTGPPGLAHLVDARVDLDGAADAFAALGRGESLASKVLVFPHGVPDPAA